MAIKVFDGGTVYTGPDIQRYRLVALKHAMRLEMKGMKRRGRSVFSIVKEEFGLKGNREKVYAAFCKLHGLEDVAGARDSA